MSLVEPKSSPSACVVGGDMRCVENGSVLTIGDNGAQHSVGLVSVGTSAAVLGMPANVSVCTAEVHHWHVQKLVSQWLALG